MEQKKKLYVVANAHLDTQWNWTIQDTIRDCVKNTLERNFDLMDKYPHYRFNFEGAFRYKLAKEYYPDLYEKLKGYVAEGRWNVAGSTWDAMDANIPSSEALMRQVLYGNGFYEKEFGKKSSDIFLADCFGFRYNLPSIEAHMGLNGFHTQKLDWGVGAPIYNEDGTVTRPEPEPRDLPIEERKPRMDIGKWIGPDGNGVAVYFYPGGYGYNFDNPRRRPVDRNHVETDDRPVGQREEYLRWIDHNEKYTGLPRHAMYYGTGDYGGSCKESSARMVNEAIEANDSNLYEVVSASTDQLFNELTKEEFDNLPVYDGELLIPHGSGAITSHTINKRWNRKNELLADSAERAAVIAAWLGASEYPSDRLLFAWQNFLWHQFHDDLPGTSIAAAYVFSYNDYVIALNMFAAELEKAIGGVTKSLDTKVEGTPIVVYNPVSVARNDVVTAELDIKTPYVRVFAPCGTEVPAQVEKVNGKTVVKFIAKTPAVSCAVFDVRASETPSPITSNLSVTENVIENQRYRVTIDANGDIASIIDKANDNKEMLAAPAGLEIGPDHSTSWPSWELTFDDGMAEPAVVKDNAKTEIVENGPAVVALKITRTYEGSTFEQTVTLWDGGQRVDVACKVNWFQRASNLRANFPLAVSNPKATLDLGLGAVESGNTDSYPYFQHVVHQWADLTNEDGSYGVSILNDCKYGMDKPNDNTLRLTLIHTPLAQFSPASGQDWQDMGLNLFTYSFVGHKGKRSDTNKEAAELNQPQFSFTTTKHDGAKKFITFATLSDDQAVIRAIKKEEKGDRIIVRVQNTADHPLEGVKLAFAANLTSATETNGYEDEIGAVPFDGNTLTLDFGKYGVRTFAVTLEAPAEKVAPVATTPLALAYDKKVTTSRDDFTSGEFGQGISVPADLWVEKITSAGIPFELASADEKNAVVSAGQTIEIPEGTTKLSILAASVNGDKEATFTVDGKPVTIGVQDFHDNVGAWEQLVNGRTPLIKRDEIAQVYTHTHDKDGLRLYLFAYWFRYEIDVTGAKTVTLPNDADILVAAATAVKDCSTVAPAAPLYDKVEDDGKAIHTLTVINCGGNAATYSYAEGKVALIRTPIYDNGYIFEGWNENDAIASEFGAAAVIKIPDHDVTVTVKSSKLGFDILQKKPAKSLFSFNAQESADQAVNGDNRTKWCSHPVEDQLWLEVDAGEVYKVNKWFVMHGGAVESPGTNTRDFKLQYRASEDEDWKVADEVTDNRENTTNREFPEVEGRYFRLWIDKATQWRDQTARIYMFQVFKAE